ncbi:MAG: biotin--[acetyl-CoA-carboxylase] ligase, partial [Intestinibacter sp.]
FPDEIKEKATSLYKENYQISRVDIVRQFCIEFEELYKEYILDGNKENTLEICRKYSPIINKEVYIIKNNKKELVKCIDINDSGNLIIKERNGQIKEIMSGEISIRGVKGYV